MNKKQEKSESQACVAKRCKEGLVSIITHLWETIWAVGASVAAAMVISTSTHRADAEARPLSSLCFCALKPCRRSVLCC
jgi:hypothetical protein